MRGYLRTEGTRKRLRFVAPGYAAEDPSVPFNMVRFDSDSHGMASILEQGEAVIPSTSRYNAVTPGMWIRTWSYGFVPLCLFAFLAYPNQGWVTVMRPSTGAGSNSMTQSQIRVSTAGIWVRAAFPKAEDFDFRIRWTALRVSAR